MSIKKKNINTRESIKPSDIIYKNKVNTKQYKQLINYKWGIGIEHEMHLFHLPLYKDTNKKITDFTILIRLILF